MQEERTCFKIILLKRWFRNGTFVTYPKFGTGQQSAPLLIHSPVHGISWLMFLEFDPAQAYSLFRFQLFRLKYFLTGVLEGQFGIFFCLPSLVVTVVSVDTFGSA